MTISTAIDRVIIHSDTSWACTVARNNIGFAENVDPYEDGTQYTYGENISWRNFNSAQLFDQGVRACKVSFDDLANFVAELPTSAPASPADLIPPTGVNGKDYAAFASRLQDYCPDGWELK